MAETIRLLQEHMARHPALEAQDAVKFLCQSCMGPGHLLDSEEAALACLNQEWAQVEARGGHSPV